MTIKESLNLTNRLIPPLEAEILLACSFKKDRTWLYKNPNDKLSPAQEKQFQKLVNRRVKGEPIAYITHLKEFYGLDFYVDSRVLIPRPETEILVEEVINEITKCYPLNTKRFTIADVGTGCGCIAISLAKKLPNIKIYATDISKKALQVAKINAKKHKILNEIKFLEGDLLKPLPEKVDIIVANLPYINPKFFKQYKNEPKIALDGGKDGLSIIKRLLKQIPDYLSKNGRIFLEIDPRQKEQLKNLTMNYLPKSIINFRRDLANLDRIAVIKLL